MMPNFWRIWTKRKNYKKRPKYSEVILAAELLKTYIINEGGYNKSQILEINRIKEWTFKKQVENMKQSKLIFSSNTEITYRFS